MDVLLAGLGVGSVGLDDGAPRRARAQRVATLTRDDVGRAGRRLPRTRRLVPGASTTIANGVRGRLTQRELEVLQLLAEGSTNGEISQRLYISPKTTKNHLAAIFQKLDVTNRTHALVRAVVMGLVTIE